MSRTTFLARQWWWDIQANLFIRPLILVIVHALLAVALVAWEHNAGAVAWLSTEPGAAQTVLATLAGAMMTVVSVVYSILLVALSLASMQFSTRILSGFVRDGTSQTVLGLFVGSFIYDLIVLRSVHTDPVPFVPGVALAGGMVLALVSLGSLLYFIHRIIYMIQANHLVDRIAQDAEQVIDEVFPKDGPDTHSAPPVPEGATKILADRCGYIQLVDIEALVSLAEQRDIWLLRPIGSFVVAESPLFAVSPANASNTVGPALLKSVDIGPIRTLQQDAEWGIRQIVDIALKAISPAVNDPSTAATCIDHLGRLLVRAGVRAAPPTVFTSPNGRVIVPNTSFPDLVDLALEQLRQYGRTDMAVALRLTRLLILVTGATRHPSWLIRIEHHARMIESAARANFVPADSEELDRRTHELRLLLDARRGDVGA